MRGVSIVVALAFVTGLTTPALGRKLENWPYDRLFKEAELIVIATADGTVDTKDKYRREGLEIDLVGQETMLTVDAVVKGDVKDQKKLKVLHYRLPNEVRIEDGPCLVSFRKDYVHLKGEINGKKFKASLGRPEYLLFLRLRPDGRYEPISGPYDPALSVREMQEPSDYFSRLGSDEGKRLSR